MKLSLSFLIICFLCSCGIKGKPLPPLNNDLATPAASSPQKIKNGN